MSTITIEGMEFHAYHGCLPEEAITGNTFIVDVYLETDTCHAIPFPATNYAFLNWTENDTIVHICEKMKKSYSHSDIFLN